MKSRRHDDAHQHFDTHSSSERNEEPSMVVSKAASAAHHRADGRGGYAPLTEAGYQQVAVLKSDEEMAKFIRRFLELHGKVVGSDGDLTGFVPFYSGTETVQTL